MAELDRKTRICAQTDPVVTGMDFVQVVDHTTQDVLHVFFLVDPGAVDGGAAFPDADFDDPTIRNEWPDADLDALSIIAPETGDVVDITAAAWIIVTRNDVARKVLEIIVAAPGGQELYDLRYSDAAMDRFFDTLTFSFKQGCPGGGDCKPGCGCPPQQFEDVAVDYLARDYGSLRAALLDFAAAHYPQWEARIAADPGMMMLEIMAALGDDFAYQQDRLAAEAYLETATQSQSVVNLARLVDYQMDHGAAATTLLTFGAHTAVMTTSNDQMQAASPNRAFALREDLGAVPFELTEEIWINPKWNDVPLYWPDAGNPCLRIGATLAYLDMPTPLNGDLPVGHSFANPQDIFIGRRIVLRSGQTNPDNPRRAWAVTITGVEPYVDLLDVGGPERLCITWAEPLPFEMPIAETHAYLNTVAAVAGRSVTELFRVGDDAAMALAYPTADAVQMRLLTALPRATERQGACAHGARGVVLRHGLTGTDTLGLSWTQDDDRQVPMLGLNQLDPDLSIPFTLDFDHIHTWDFVNGILDADAEDRAFTLEHGMWSEAVRFQKPSGDVVLNDYISGAGFSLRFGDRDFGISPQVGAVLEARFLTAPGMDANLPPDVISNLSPPEGADDIATITWADWVTNPFAVTDARVAETLDSIRINAPEAFRAILLRAVRNEDYRTILERRDSIQQANAATRWTGSWATDFVAVDPAGTQILSDALRIEIARELDCVRQAGRSVCHRDADYIPIDISVDVCVSPNASNAAMTRKITQALVAYFDPDNFTFGTPLIRSGLEAAVHCVPGVRGVEETKVRRRGKADFELLPARLMVAPHQILQLANDAARPERGYIEISAHGGG
ncbi:MAG: hypothetical protein ACSHWS_07670 [Sulfitobacter sp.]